MKKYLRLLYIALFAMMSVSLTACGDDEDEPNGGGNNTSSNFTLNGVAYGSGHIGSGENNNWYHDYKGVNGLGGHLQAELYPLSNDRFEYWPNLNISLETAIEPLKEGMTLKITGGWVEDVTDMFKGTNYKYDEIVSGNITVSALSSSHVTFQFNNLKMTNEKGTIILNGPLKCEYITFD